MTLIRRHMRLWAAVWFVLQAASLSAFVPRDCCAARRLIASHKAHASHETESDHGKPVCHETPAEETGTHCPMPHADADADGAACPMHRDGDRGAAEPRGNPCAMRGTCDGPTALATLLSNHGVLTESFERLPDRRTTSPVLRPAIPGDDSHRRQ